MKGLQASIKRLETSDELLLLFRTHAKTEGGRLTEFGNDLVHASLKAGIRCTDIAKFLEVSTSAISQKRAMLDDVI